MDFLIRNMTKGDISRVGEILYESFNGVASKHGYAPKMRSLQVGKSWAWAMLHHGPSELLTVEVDNRVVGICCLNPRGDLGGVGPVAVDPHFQHCALGRELMHALLRRTGSLQGLRLIQEAFNPASFSFYYSLNFMPVANLLDLFLDGSVERRLDSCTHVSELTAKDLDGISAYDRPRSKLDRRTDFAYYANWGKVFVYRHASQIRGFLACLPGSESVQLGPLLADGEEEAISLFRHALAVYKDRFCRTRVMARDYLFAKTLQGWGFKIYSIDLLMVRGMWPLSKYVEAFGIFPEGI